MEKQILNLEELAGGGLAEKVNSAMKKVLENMQDPNTPWKVKRSITVKMAFTQNEDRDDTAVELSVDTKTAPASPIITRMAIGKNLESGEIFAEEYGPQIRGQMSLNDYEAKPEQEGTTDKAADEPTETTGNVTDFRAVKEA